MASGGAPRPQTQPLYPLQISDYAPDTRRLLLIFQVVQSYNKKLVSVPNNSRYMLQENTVVPLLFKYKLL